MKDAQDLREEVSALVDGQLAGDEVAHVVARIGARDELTRTWEAYHVVGEVLRTGAHATGRDSSAFLAGFRARLAAEAPREVRPEPAVVAAMPQLRAEAANEPVFRWKLVAGLASVAAATAIGWNWMGAMNSGTTGAQLALQQAPQASGSVVATSVQTPAGNPSPVATQVLVGEGRQPQVMLRDPRLDALLEAHQQAGGASQMPSGFLRNATFEGPTR